MAAFLIDSQAVAADPSCAWAHAEGAGQAALASCSAHLLGWATVDHWYAAQAVAVVLEPAVALDQVAHGEAADAAGHAAAVGGRHHPAVAADWTDADWTDADWTDADWTDADWTNADWRHAVDAAAAAD